MQRVSSKTAYTIRTLYSSIGRIITGSKPDPFKINYSLNNIYTMFFRVPIRGDKVEIPIFGSYNTVTRLLNSVEENTRRDIVMPFFSSYVSVHDPVICRTSDALLRHLTNHVSSTAGMYICCETNKGERYYGCNGTIFNSDMTLIFFNVIEVDISGTGLTYRKVKTYIHPSVFYSEGIIEKCIVNKVIPYVLQHGVRVCSPSMLGVTDGINYEYGKLGTIPELVVTDVGDKFFCRTVLPNTIFKDEDISEMLDRNIEDVFSILKI